jgi:hypothetical protein
MPAQNVDVILDIQGTARCGDSFLRLHEN